MCDYASTVTVLVCMSTGKRGRVKGDAQHRTMSARLSAFDGGVGPAVETRVLDVADGGASGRCVHPPTYAVGWAKDEVLAISSRSVSPLDRVGTHLAELVSLHRDGIRAGADSRSCGLARTSLVMRRGSDGPWLLCGWRAVTVEISHR